MNASKVTIKDNKRLQMNLNNTKLYDFTNFLQFQTTFQFKTNFNDVTPLLTISNDFNEFKLRLTILNYF